MQKAGLSCRCAPRGTRQRGVGVGVGESESESESDKVRMRVANQRSTRTLASAVDRAGAVWSCRAFFACMLASARRGRLYPYLAHPSAYMTTPTTPRAACLCSSSSRHAPAPRRPRAARTQDADADLPVRARTGALGPRGKEDAGRAEDANRGRVSDQAHTVSLSRHGFFEFTCLARSAFSFSFSFSFAVAVAARAALRGRNEDIERRLLPRSWKMRKNTGRGPGAGTTADAAGVQEPACSSGFPYEPRAHSRPSLPHVCTDARQPGGSRVHAEVSE